MVGAAWQGRGYATESAQALVSWLRERGVVTITAAIHPDHAASAAVARRAGLVPTAEYADGEVSGGWPGDEPPPIYVGETVTRLP